MSALSSSSIFLLERKICSLKFAGTTRIDFISYIYYHYNHGSTAFLGQGIVRPIYFFILISHLILAAITLPAVLVTFYFAFISQFKLHTAISSYTLYAWLYVSLSGIVIYGFLKYFNGI